MRRDHNDFCAEISRRKDHIVNKRRQRRRMLLCCIPFVVCVFVFAAVGSSGLLKRAETAEGETGAVATYAPEGVSGPYITVSIPGRADDEIVIDEESDVFAFLEFIESNSNMFMRSDGDGWYLYSAVINTERSSELVVEVISTDYLQEEIVEETEAVILPEAPESVLETATECETELETEHETALSSEDMTAAESAEATKKAEESTKRAETFATGENIIPETELVDETYTEGGDELETEKIEEAETEKSEEETPCDTHTESFIYHIQVGEESVKLYFEQSIVITLTDAEGNIVKYALPIWLNEAFKDELMTFLESLG